MPRKPDGLENRPYLRALLRRAELDGINLVAAAEHVAQNDQVVAQVGTPFRGVRLISENTA
jgi:hypothetical protein